tara:strand:+ start:183 stop:500 length:318 start_codon:yes stop_codon:yes gene_type:complete
MKKLYVVVFALALVALNPRFLPCKGCLFGLPQAVISCSTGLQVHWGKLLILGNIGHKKGLVGVYTKETAADAVVHAAYGRGPVSKGLMASATRTQALKIFSWPCS